MLALTSINISAPVVLNLNRKTSPPLTVTPKYLLLGQNTISLIGFGLSGFSVAETKLQISSVYSRVRAASYKV